MVSVTVCAALVAFRAVLEKVKLAGASATVALKPVPESATVCGLPAALSLIVSAPVRFPEAVGVKVTFMAQVPLLANELGQLLVCAKSPEAAMLLMVRFVFP